jgi:hypothetical protein
MLVFYGFMEVLYGSANTGRGGAVNGLDYRAGGARARAVGFATASTPA